MGACGTELNSHHYPGPIQRGTQAEFTHIFHVLKMISVRLQGSNLNTQEVSLFQVFEKHHLQTPN